MKININTHKNYDVIIEDHVLSKAADYISQLRSCDKVCIVTDSNVNDIYGNFLEKELTVAGFKVYTFVFSPGEEFKNLKTFGQLLEFLAESHFTRSDMLIALGGGIVGDVCGYAAASYLRGISYIQIPTTLLSAVDSSVGGKTGINLSAGKNQCGAFWQPDMVICDPAFLLTLPPEEISCGMAEVIKYAAVLDNCFFDALLGNNSVLPFEKIIGHCISLKAAIVEEDEYDNGKRQILNFGHTVGHAIEKCSHYTFSHGASIAMGMLIVTKASYKIGLSPLDCSLPLEEIFKKYGLTYWHSYNSDDLFSAILQDKKRRGDTMNIVLLNEIGHGFIHPMNISELKDFIDLGL